jgi:glycosyltransferase involved in cell wall biosynthesis
MRAAKALLLPSRVEATPLVILEAMSHGLPWIATPGCGAVHEHAGGRIVPLTDFLPTARALLADEPARRALGAAGQEHWEACYTWDAIAPRYDALLRGASELPPPAAPAAAPVAA